MTIHLFHSSMGPPAVLEGDEYPRIIRVLVMAAMVPQCLFSCCLEYVGVVHLYLGNGYASYVGIMLGRIGYPVHSRPFPVFTYIVPYRIELTQVLHPIFARIIIVRLARPPVRV